MAGVRAVTAIPSLEFLKGDMVLSWKTFNYYTILLFSRVLSYPHLFFLAEWFT